MTDALGRRLTAAASAPLDASQQHVIQLGAGIPGAYRCRIE